MSTEDDAEKASRILQLAQVMLRAGQAMEDSNWLQCQKLCGEAARMSRVLVLMEEGK